MITLIGVSKERGAGRFKSILLEDINWTIPPLSHTVILGQPHSGTAVLLEIVAGLSFPTGGWVERRASTSVPGGYLRYAGFGTLRHLIARLSQLYNADPKEIAEFVVKAVRRDDVMDVPVRQIPTSLRWQLNMALTYAVPSDFYLLNHPIEGGRDIEFRAFCRQAFALRRKQAGTIVVLNSSRLAAGLGNDTIGGVLYRSRLTLYERLDDAIAVFDNLPPEALPAADATPEPAEPRQEDDEIF